MNRFMWLTLPISVALFTACGSSTDPVAPLTPEQVSLLATQTTIELPAGGQVSKTFTLTNTSASEISYSSSVAFPNGTPSWLTLTAGQSGKIAPSANQVVTFTATCPNVAVTSQYTAVIALAVASGDVSLTKTTTATLKCIVTPPVSSPDTTRPVLSLQALTTTTSNQVTVTGTASDNVAVTRVAYSLNGGASTDVAIQAGASVPLSFTVGGLAVGSNTITVTAYDAAGLVSDVSTLTVTSAPVVADTSKP
ncbi:MAG: hypothetical protein JWQ08_197, partial [Deinococcus sp.]|nr:hypothetical protein [Deinococcus sp.]